MDKASFLNQIDSFIETTIQAQGYQKTEFLQYLNSKKVNGDKIELWNLDEMLVAREEFVNLKQQQQEVNHEYIDKNNIQQFEQIDQYNYFPSDNQKENLEDEKIPQAPLAQYVNIQENVIIGVDKRYKVYQGQQIQIDQNSFLYKHPNIEVKIQNYQEQQGSLFSKSYIQYNIILDPYEYMISRRYSDFDKLREYLVKNYPDYYVPPIPQKVTSVNNNKIADFRSLGLEKFLNIVIRQFWFDSLVDKFFGCQNDKDLQNYLKQQKQRQYDIQNLKTLNGKVECQTSAQIENYFQYQLTNLNKDMEYQNNIRQISKKIVDLNKQLSQEYKLLSDQFNNLQQRNKNQNEQLPEKIDEIYYQNLNKMFLIQSQKQEEIGSIVTKHLDYFYKYQIQMSETLKDKIKQRNEYLDESLKLLQKIDQKIDKQFKELSDIQIQQKLQTQGFSNEKLLKQQLFPKESKQFETIQDNFGYINNHIYYQTQMIINMNQYNTIQNILNMQQKITQIHLEMNKENEQLLGKN